jgi:DNA-binding response OmpR family regulator
MSSPGENQVIRVLLVDDDPVVLKVYEKELSNRGFKIERAMDGIEALRALRNNKPDLMVLDLMMPKMSGEDVLKFMQTQRELAPVPVIVLSNAYLDGLSRDAASAGAQKALLKSSCTPAKLAAEIQEVLRGRPVRKESPAPREIKQGKVILPPPPPAYPAAAPAPAKAPAVPADSGPKVQVAGAESWNSNIRKEFLQHGQGTCAELRSLFQALSNAQNDAERNLRLQNFYQKVHFVTAAAGMAECFQIARMAEAVEAFIFEINGKRTHLNPSSLHTLALTVDFIGLLFAYAQKSNVTPPWSPKAVVIDDDPLLNRLVVSALSSAEITGTAFEKPLVAMDWLREHDCDLVLLDIEMPVMDGFQVCKLLRTLPKHQETPVVYVTQHDDFEHRAKSALSGGDDLIGKPILPLELAVKAVMHVLDRQLALLDRA